MRRNYDFFSQFNGFIKNWRSESLEAFHMKYKLLLVDNSSLKLKWKKSLSKNILITVYCNNNNYEKKYRVLKNAAFKMWMNGWMNEQNLHHRFAVFAEHNVMKMWENFYLSGDFGNSTVLALFMTIFHDFMFLGSLIVDGASIYVY